MLKPVLGQFEKAGVTPKRKLSEFRVTEDALLPVGTRLNAGHFLPGQYVDVQSTRLVSINSQLVIFFKFVVCNICVESL